MKPEDVEISVDANGSAMLLGSGSFGSVFKGMRQGVQPVAVKRLHQADPSEMTLFHKVGWWQQLLIKASARCLCTRQTPGVWQGLL